MSQDYKEFKIDPDDHIALVRNLDDVSGNDEGVSGFIFLTARIRIFPNCCHILVCRFCYSILHVHIVHIVKGLGIRKISIHPVSPRPIIALLFI